MKIIGTASKPWTRRPDSLFTEGEKGPWITLAPRARSQVSAACVSAATTARSSTASSAPNCAGDAPFGTMSL